MELMLLHITHTHTSLSLLQYLLNHHFLYLQIHNGPIFDVKFSNDGSKIASCSSDKTVSFLKVAWVYMHRYMINSAIHLRTFSFYR